MHRLVVLGTGTEVGKTWVACALARAARPRRTIALKPIETGCTPADAPDAAALARAAGAPYIPPRYCYPQPVTPWLAATMAGTSIDLKAIAAWIDESTAPFATPRGNADAGLCIIETAGGTFSPIAEGETNLDLARYLKPDATVLVVPNRLGCLHDAKATLDAMRLAGDTPTLLLLNCGPWTDSSTAANLTLLQRLHPTLAVHAIASEKDATSAYNILLTFLPAC